MNDVENLPETRTRFTVVTWNILMDKTRSARDPEAWDYIRPQSLRTASHAETLRGLGVDLDVVAIQEAHETNTRHGGVELAQRLGFEASFWYEHNRSKRHGERIGMFGSLVANTDVVELPHDKKMVLTSIGDVAVANIHNRNEMFGPMRAEQMREIIRSTEQFDKLVIVGDANDVPWGKSLRYLRGAGLHPAQWPGAELHPKTHPTERYRTILQGEAHTVSLPDGSTAQQGRLPLPKRILNVGLPLDIVYLRNVHATDGGVFEGDSDHRGRWVTIQSI